MLPLTGMGIAFEIESWTFLVSQNFRIEHKKLDSSFKNPPSYIELNSSSFKISPNLIFPGIAI